MPVEGSRGRSFSIWIRCMMNLSTVRSATLAYSLCTFLLMADGTQAQEQAIPIALTGQDLIGQAKTGTGKTLGFGLPMLERLGLNPELGAKALVVVPTRELAIQVAEDLVLAASNRETKIATIYGGKSYEGQIAQLEAGAQVIVGTPGRLIDLSNQKKLDLSKIQIMVLDEADKMLKQYRYFG